MYAIPPVIEFTDGTLLVLQSDDEGNDGGAGLVIPADNSGDYLYTHYDHNGDYYED